MTIEPARKREAGQVLPLLVLALVGLLGFAALALDGGNLYTEQRRAQAAADNAVMAAAFQQMNGVTGNGSLASAAFASAAQNGYTPLDPHTKIVFYLPPAHGAYAGNNSYMEVQITQTVPTALAHLVYGQDPIPVTVIAVAHGNPTGPLMAGYALAAMKPDCTGVSIVGEGGGNSGRIYLTDGGAFDNAPNPCSLVMNGNHDKVVTNGPPIDTVANSYSGTLCTPAQTSDPASKCNFYPRPTINKPQVTQDPLQGTPAATPPPCGPLQPPPVNGSTILPGSYATLSGNFTMSPGIYCLGGGQLSGNVSGTGVLIYLKDSAANIRGTGNSSTGPLTAPTTASTGCQGNADPSQDICKYLGIVVYKVKGANTCSPSDIDIDFLGNASLTLAGLVYMPYSLVRWGGNGSLTMTGQMIVGCVKFNGNGNLNIIYNPRQIYSPPPSIRLDQ